jgi:hypothetical protein
MRHHRGRRAHQPNRHNLLFSALCGEVDPVFRTMRRLSD